MKTLLLSVAVFFSVKVYPQQEPENNYKKRDNYFYVSPAELFFNTFQIGYERNLRNHNTIAFATGFKL
ncbi:MAG: hypothetical protein K0S12_2189, partial [Bacteroidetes bacterium]|nr:hypothetical protein [Bacteroidota bacterium]